jgi:hypothetical protein
VETHPSFLELDRQALKASTEATQAHVAACAECQAYLGRLQMEVAIPAWVRAPRPPRVMSGRWRLWALAGTFAVTSVAVVVSYRAAGFGTHPAIEVEKANAPGLALYIRRGDRVILWDRREPVYPGDSLRLQIAPLGFRHIQVTSKGESLYEGDLATGAIDFLPVSWKVDDAPGTETLDVTLSGPSSPPWTTRLSLTKAARP